MSDIDAIIIRQAPDFVLQVQPAPEINLEVMQVNPAVNVPAAPSPVSITVMQSSPIEAVQVLVPAIGAAPPVSLTDFVSDTVAYRGEAMTTGADTSAPVWRIQKITVEYGSEADAFITWAEASQDFIFAWDLRYTYSYS